MMNETSTAPKDGTREIMFSYWENFQPSLESMMLDPKAQMLNAEENNEILSLLPSITGKTVLELGAGIGRFTSNLAQKAAHVTAVDFMESYIDANRRYNSHMKNITFLQADVMELQLPFEKYDIVFSNWLFMYLDDEECIGLTQKILCWLKNGGHLFFRESCFKPSGDVQRSSNPTFYRSPAEYYNILNTVRSQELASGEASFLVDTVKNVQAYVKHKKNPCQICFLASKMTLELKTENYNSFQQFLDQQQYSKEGVNRYEWIFGETFLSTGGFDTTKDIISNLPLKPGEYVLDVGCGTGGHDFYLAEKFDVKILAVDLSVNMMSVALNHLSKRPALTSKIQFETCDITKVDYNEGTFDVIYSRDALLHIGDKETLFQKFYKWLAPGGRLLFTDYSRGDKEHSAEFKKYVAQRGYHLFTVAQYDELMKKSGFINVEAKDNTTKFLEALTRELNKLQTHKVEFMQKFSAADYEHLKDGWNAKIKRVADGDQTWCLGYGEKPNL